jgi:hypothetical protein
VRLAHGKWAQYAPKTPTERLARCPFGHISTPIRGQRSFVQTFPRLIPERPFP